MLDLVAFGEILWDLFEERRAGPSAHAPAPLARTFRREFGGGPANVVTAMARLGARTALLGGVGRDPLGDALLAHLRADAVSVRFVQRLPKRTGLTFVLRDPRGEPHFIFYRHDSADLGIRPDHVRPAMGRARWVLVGTSTMMTRDQAAATARVLDVAAEAGARVVVDLNVRPHMWSDEKAMRRAIETLAGRATVVKASDDDLRAVAPRGRGARWLERFAPGATWLLTRGAGVASAIGAHGRVDAPARRGPCVDATGAGDAFLAGALTTLLACNAAPGRAAWFNPEVWRAALSVGHMMGQKAVSRPGAVAGLIRLGRPRAAIDVVRRRFA